MAADAKGVPYSKIVPVPYERKLNGFLEPKRIRIVGNPYAGSPKQSFAVNLYNSDGEIVFHFNPRIVDKVVVRNTTKDKNFVFHTEERGGGCPFVLDKQFTLDIVASGLKISCFVDSKKFCDFTARDDLSRVTKLEIKEDIVLNAVSVTEDGKLPMPVSIPLGGFMPPQRIRLIGTPIDEKENDYFDVLFKSGNDTFMSYWPRFDERWVGRNNCINGVWQNADGDKEANFPFEYGQKFIIDFVAKDKSVEILVDGKKHCEFAHRNDFSKINLLSLPSRGEMILHQLTLEHGPGEPVPTQQVPAAAAGGKKT